MSMDITLSRASKAIEAGKVVAAELGIPFTISIVDAGAHVVAVSRMDGAALVSIEVSQAKARTSVLFAQPTKGLAGAAKPGGPTLASENGSPGPLALIAPGIPLLACDRR